MEIYIYIYLGIITFLLYRTLKNKIYSRIYGKRYQYVHVIETGDCGYALFDKNLRFGNLNGMTIVYNFAKIKGDTLFYANNCSEPLEVSFNKDKCEYWVDSNEYEINLKNDLLQTLMMLRSKDQIIILLIVCIIVEFFIMVYLWQNFGNIDGKFELIYNEIIKSRTSQV